METERRTSPSEALQTRVDFLEAAKKDGAHQKITTDSDPIGVKRKIARLRNIVGILNGSPATGADLGRQYGVERERIRQLHNEGMRRFHHHSSPQTQEKFPLESISNTRKPWPWHSRERNSEMQGAVSISIRKAMEKGAKTVGEISKATGFSKNKVRSSRKTLRVWGAEVPKRDSIDYDEIKKKVDKEEDWGKLQGILDSRSGASIRGHIQRHKKTDQELFVFLGAVIREAGFYVANRQMRFFYETLRSQGIPVRKTETGQFIRGKGDKLCPQCYYIAFAKHKDIIVEAFNNNPSLL